MRRKGVGKIVPLALVLSVTAALVCAVNATQRHKK